MAELKRIYWDAGHGGSQPGAVKYVIEKEVNIKVVNSACAYMEKNHQCEIYKDITSDSIYTICQKANEWGADLFISVHFNAGGGDGYEGLVYNSTMKALGECFAKHVKAAGQNLRSSSIAPGVKYRPDLGVLRLTEMDAILNECAFVDNKKDIKDCDEDAELKKMGIALAEAAADWLDLPKKSNDKTATTKKDDFLVRVKIEDLNIRAGAGTKYKSEGFIKPGVYTIVETSGKWGKLKSSTAKRPRWIHLDYVERL